MRSACTQSSHATERMPPLVSYVSMMTAAITAPARRESTPPDIEAIAITEFRASARHPTTRHAVSRPKSSSTAAAMQMEAAASTWWYVSGICEVPSPVCETA